MYDENNGGGGGRGRAARPRACISCDGKLRDQSPEISRMSALGTEPVAETTRSTWSQYINTTKATVDKRPTTLTWVAAAPAPRRHKSQHKRRNQPANNYAPYRCNQCHRNGSLPSKPCKFSVLGNACLIHRAQPGTAQTSGARATAQP